MTTRPRFITRINWEDLKKQKNSFLKTRSEIQKQLITQDSSPFNVKDIDNLDGILHLIDAIQDYAVDVMGISEEEVFKMEE